MESGGAQEVTAGSHDFKRGLSDDALKDEDGLPQAEGHDSSGGVGLAGNSRAAFARDPSRKKQALERESVPVFPVFRSPSQRKTVHLIRHGESEFNAACMGIGPKERNEIFDARLTQRGRAQARSLCKKLQAMACDNVVWVVSPLSRAIETFLLACPDARMLNARLSADTAPSDLPFKVVVTPLISEHMATTGDVGRPPQVLCGDFPELANEISTIRDETWWHSTPAAPNSALSMTFNTPEPKQAMLARVAAFRKWVLGRREHMIFAVGHGVFFKCLTGQKHILRNCDMCSIKI